MSQWQLRFAEKVQLVQSASRDRFDEVAERTIGPVFDQLRAFTGNLGLQSSTPVSKEGIRTFKFAMSENAYVLLSFRLLDLERGEANVEFFVPGKTRPQAAKRAAALVEMNTEWVRSFFEQSLDTFVEAYVETLSGKGAVKAELVGA